MAVVGFIAKMNEELKLGHIEKENFAILEKEFMKIDGVKSVLTIFWKHHMREHFDQDCLEDISRKRYTC